MSDDVLRAILAQSRDAIIVLDTAGTITFASHVITDMLGWTPDEVLGTSGFARVHPDDLQAGLLAVVPQINQEDAPPITVRIAQRDGAWRHVELKGSLLEDAAGETTGLILNLRDVEWRTESEAALRRSEERFRALVQGSSDAIVVIDASAAITYASPAVTPMFDRVPEAVIGTSAVDWLHPDDVGLMTERLVAVLDEPGSTTKIELRISHNDGSWRWVEASAANLMDNEAVEGIVVHLRDITDTHEAREALERSERLFRSLAQSSPTGIFQLDADGNCIYTNERWTRITGVPAEAALGTGWRSAVHPDDMARLGVVPGEPSTTNRSVRQPLALNLRVLRPDGEVRWVTVRTQPMLQPDGTSSGAVGVVTDVTERMEAMRDNQRLIDIFEATHDLVGIAGLDGALLYVNRSARRFFGLPEHGGLEGRRLLDYFPTEVAATLTTDVLDAVARDGMWYGELSMIDLGGRPVPMLCQLLVHTDDDGNVEFFSGVFHDISRRKNIESQLEHQATHDPLTGLPNRTLLLERLEQALERARRHQKRVAVLFLDLDHFKVVNDSLGHGVGDRLLVTIADRLRTVVRPRDTIARFGGDEFVVLCEDVEDSGDAVAVAERVISAISGPFEIDETEVFVGVSIGIAFPDGADADPGTLIRDADAAMYRAKERGRGRWAVFDNAMRASAVDRLDIENALRRAQERRELRVHYQPIVSLTTGAVEGVEALLRWEHPERGLLNPGDFIGVAEETGLIVPIGTWVLDQACRQVQRWMASHPELAPLRLSVNLSGRQLGHPSLVEDVAAILADTGIDPSGVELEITESVLMDDVEMSEDTLGRLKALGVKLGVDDFGTGYSSLSYLRRFPVDVLKVDRSFVDGLGTDPSDSAIVTAIVTLAHTLGLHAVAEGVETDDQLRELRRLRCDYAQGFLLARPANGQAIGDLLVSQPRW